MDAQRAGVGDGTWLEQVAREAEGRLEPGEASINVCFSTTGACLSRWIRGYTGSLVSHAIISFRDRTLNRVMVMQASGHGYEVIPWGRWEKANILIARFRLPAEIADPPQVHALRAIARRIGDGYDARGLFGFVPVLWYRLKRWLPARLRVRQQGRAGGAMQEPWRPRFHNWLDNPAKLFCSEAVAEFLGYCCPEWQRDYFQRPPDWSPENLLGFARSKLEPILDDQKRTQRRQAQLAPRYWQRLHDRYGVDRPAHIAAR
jgi:hypothetical protein